MSGNLLAGRAVQGKSVRRARLSGAVVASAAVAGLASVAQVHAALTVVDFAKGSTLVTGTNYYTDSSGTTLANTQNLSTSLVDVTEAFTGNTFGFYNSAAPTPPSTNNGGTSVPATYTVGALAFDSYYASGTNFFRTYGTSTTASTTAAAVNVTLALTGGNTGTTANTTTGTVSYITPQTNAGDLITVTANAPTTTLEMYGYYGNTYISLPTGGGNFNIASGHTLQLNGVNNTLPTAAVYSASLVDSVISGTPTANATYGLDPVTITGGGTFDVYSRNTNFTGGFIVNNGTLQTASVYITGGSLSSYGDVLGLAPSTPTPNVTLGGGILSFTNSFTTSALSSTREFALATPVAGTTADTISVSSGQRVVAQGAVIDAAGSTGAPFVKGGAGNLTLAAVNTYSGATTVANGTLIMDGTAANSPSVTVASGATLGGQGSVGGSIITTSGSIVSPGSPLAYSGHTATPAGTFTAGSLSMAAGSVYNFDLEATTNDLLVLNGSGATGGGGVFNLYQSGTANAVDPGLYDLFAFTGSAVDSLNLATLTIGNMPNATYTFVNDPANGDLAVNITSVPEPMTLGLISLGAIVGLRRRRNV